MIWVFGILCVKSPVLTWELKSRSLIKHRYPSHIYKFLNKFSVVTIYATLGDEAIAHGINETDVTTVITTYDLLPKFKKILAKTPRVETIIFMEDQLKIADRSGYKEGIRIIGYKDVLQKGIASKIGELLIAVPR